MGRWVEISLEATRSGFFLHQRSRLEKRVMGTEVLKGLVSNRSPANIPSRVEVHAGYGAFEYIRDKAS